MKVISSPIASYEIYGNIVIGIYDEGVDVTASEIPHFVNMVNEHIEGDFAFITDNKNSYSVNPTIPIETCKQLPNLKFFANVIYYNLEKDITKITKLTFPEYVKLNKFNTLSEAIRWVKEGLGGQIDDVQKEKA